jgi:ORF6N domain
MRVQNPVVPLERIEKAIFFLRGHKAMLSTHLAELYEVEPRALVQAVKRNIERFPPDFMFQLSKVEFENLKSQIVTSNWGGLRRAAPYAFTEQGIAMLSSVLNSRRAVQVNIEIMRAFVRLRELMATHKDLVRRLNKMEKKYDAQFRLVFDAIRELTAPPTPKKRKIGFLVKERAARYGRT